MPARPGKPAQQRPERLPPVAHIELLLAVHFPEGTPERRIVEQRIVSKPALPARGVKDLPFHFAPKSLPNFPALSQRNHADESSTAARPVAQSTRATNGCWPDPSHQRACIARRVYARFAAQSIHFEPRIVREKRPRRKPAVIRRFQPGILFECGAVFFRSLYRFQVRQRLNIDAEQFPRQPEFAQLPRIARRAIDLHANAIAAC